MQLLHIALIAARSDGRFIAPAFSAPPPVFWLYYQAREPELVIAAAHLLEYRVPSAFHGRHIGLSERLPPLREPFSCEASGGLPLSNRAHAVRTYKASPADRYRQELALTDEFVSFRPADT